MSKQVAFHGIQEMFEKLSIPEIKRALSHSQSSASASTLELRGLVAKRYPDLLESAGTVLEMKTKTHAMHQVLCSIPPICNDIANHTWGAAAAAPGSTTTTTTTTKTTNGKDGGRNPPPPVPVVQWETYPERIWDALDNRDFVLAARVLIQEYISSNQNTTITTSTSQHAQQRQFAAQIKRHAKQALGNYQKLKGEERNDPIVVGALSTLVLFGATEEEALSTLLARRLTCIKHCMAIGSMTEEQQEQEHNIKITAEYSATSNSSGNNNNNNNVQRATSRMQMALHCVNATINSVEDAFVDSHVSATLDSLVVQCSAGTLDELLLLTTNILLLDSSNNKNETNTVSVNTCSMLASVWLKEVVHHMHSLEDVLLPSTMTAHQVAAVQQSLSTTTRTTTLIKTAALLPSCDVQYANKNIIRGGLNIHLHEYQFV